MSVFYHFFQLSYQVMQEVKNTTADEGDTRDVGSLTGLGRSPGEGMQPIPVFLAGESRGQRSLVGYSPQSRKQSNTTEATYHACVKTFFFIFFVCFFNIGIVGIFPHSVGFIFILLWATFGDLISES